MRALAAPASRVRTRADMKQERAEARNVRAPLLQRIPCVAPGGDMRRLAARLGRLSEWSGLCPAVVLALGVLLLAGRVWANGLDPAGPPNERTAAPLEGSCVDALCHNDEFVDSGLGELLLIVPLSYVPDEVYKIEVHLSQADQMRWGFELAVLDAAGSSAGSLTSMDGETQVAVSNGTTEPLGREYVKHTPLGTAAGQPDDYAWSFQWTAPSEDAGPVTFYAAGNAADNNDFQFRLPGTDDAGDFIYTAQQTVPLAEPSRAALAMAAAAALGAIARVRRVGSP